MLPQWFHFDEGLRDAFTALYAGTSTRFVIELPTNGSSNISPDHVPKLIWPECFQNLSHFFGDEMGEPYARRFCSMGLIRLLGAARTWADAGAQIGMDADWARDLANRGTTVIGLDQRDAFWRALREELDKRQDSTPVDYREREAALSDFRDIDREAWHGICRQADVAPGKAGGRSRYAAAWLWAELTSGDWREAPAFGGNASENRREIYRRFLRDPLPRLEATLLAHADETIR